MDTTAKTVVENWFGEDLDTPDVVSDLARRWFSSDPAFDERIRVRFGALPDRALKGDLADWRRSPHGTLALALVLDQFPRNLYRGTPRSFAYDSAAVDVAREAIASHVDRALHPLERVFLYLPFEHAEDLTLQNECVSLFEELAEQASPQMADQFSSFLEYAERHRSVIAQFGRFPHRNSILGRPSSAEERQFLDSGGDTFG